MKRKAVWNLLNPEITYRDYEKHVEETIENVVKGPSQLLSLFKLMNDDFEILKSLEQVPLQNRTLEKPTWEGASGYSHQIDASFSTQDERVILLIESKHLKKSVDFPSFSAFLIRVIDIRNSHTNSLVLGLLVTTQGPKGKAGGTKIDQDCIDRVRSQFSKMRYYVSFLWLPD